MSKLFRPFSAQNETTSNNVREDSIKRSSRLSYESAPASYAEKAELAATNLNSDVQIKGTIRFNESLRLDGRFEGELHSDSGLLIVGKNGDLKATITVGSAIIEGCIQGNIIAKDKIELRSSARHYGDIKASRLVVEEGVLFVGKCDVNPQQTAQPNRDSEIIEEEEGNAQGVKTTPSHSFSNDETDGEDLQEDFLR